MHNLGLAIQWREDVEKGEFISAPNYTKEYLGFDTISDKELGAICAGVNSYYEVMGSDMRIYHYMGELIPGFKV